MNVLISLRSEILKTKRTASFYFTILSAIVVPLLFVLDVCADGISPENMKNPLRSVYVEGLKGLNFLVLPMFVILVCTLLPQLEYRNNTWKQVFTSPQTMARIYLAKFLHLQVVIVSFLLLFFISMMASTFIINLVNPSIKVFTYKLDWGEVLMYAGRTYASVVALSVLQFIIGLMMKNFIAPIACGLALWIVGNLLLFEAHSSLANMFPYSYSAMVMVRNCDKLFPMIQWSSIGFGVVFLAAGYVLFIRKKARS
jgi:hypothetical protein